MGSIPKLSVIKGKLSTLPDFKYLHRLFEENAALHPDTTAVIYNGLISNDKKQASFLKINQASNRLARCFMDHIQDNQNSDHDYIIAVSLPPSEVLIITLLAIWKCGAAYLPLDVNAPSARVKHILAEAKPVLIITHKQFDKNDEAFKGQKVFSFATLNSDAAEMPSSNLDDSEMLPKTEQPLAIVLYTSGSTGVPKGVRLPHKVVFNRLKWQWKEFPFNTTEFICVFKTTLTFVDAVAEIWAPLLYKDPRTILVVAKEITKDPQKLIPLLQEYEVERLVLVPTLLRAILMYLEMETSKQLHKLKIWVCSGEPLPVSLAEQFFKYFPNESHLLCNFYGSTEIMGDVTFHVLRSKNDIVFQDKVPIGLPVDNTAIYLLDKQLCPVPAEELGEIYVAGLNVCAGYVNGRDSDRFFPNLNAVDKEFSRLYRTGDYGRLSKNVITYEGRTDSQVKVRGNRVDLAEVDAALGKISGIQKHVVLCYKPGDIEQVIIAYVTLRPDVNLRPEVIENKLSSSLPPYAIPQVLLTNNIPLLNNGKVDRQLLLKQYAKLISNGNTLEMDFTNVSEKKIHAAECLLKTISTVLGGAVRNKISLNSNFYYHLGGNSLNSVLTVTKLREQGYYIGISDFISSKSLWDVLEKITHEDSFTIEDVHATQKQYDAELISNKHKTNVYQIITDSFYEKGDLEQWIEPRKEDYSELLDEIWKPLVDAKLSFVMKSKTTGRVEGVSLNFDAHDEPPVTLSGPLLTVLTFLEYVEGPIRDNKLPKGKNQIFHTFMMGTEKSLSAAENVAVIQAMEEEVISLAKRRDFTGIFTSNTSPLTQQLGTDIFNYIVMEHFQVNTYVTENGFKPFGEAPDNQKVSCSWLKIKN